MKKILHVVVAFLGVLVIWQSIVQFGHYNQALFPAPVDVLLSFQELMQDNRLIIDIQASLYRFFWGYGIAVILGIVLGLILGWLNCLWQYFNPLVQLFRPISPMAWLPFIVLWFGIGDLPAVIIIFIAAFFPILLSTVSAVANVEQTYLKVAKNFGLNQLQTLLKIVLPSSFPRIATGLHLALGTAWVFLVAGEMVGAQSGLGYLIIDARNNLRLDHLMAAMLVIGVLGLILDTLIHLVENWIFQQWGIAQNERSQADVY